MRFKTTSDMARERVLLEVTGPQPVGHKTPYADLPASQFSDDPKYHSDPAKAAKDISIDRDEARARRHPLYR